MEEEKEEEVVVIVVVVVNQSYVSGLDSKFLRQDFTSWSQYRLLSIMSRYSHMGVAPSSLQSLPGAGISHLDSPEVLDSSSPLLFSMSSQLSLSPHPPFAVMGKRSIPDVSASHPIRQYMQTHTHMPAHTRTTHTHIKP